MRISLLIIYIERWDSSINIKDFPQNFTSEDLENIWEYIFKRQHELIAEYGPIEMKQGLRWVLNGPVNLDDPKGQLQLKDFAWRVVEEIGESLEAFDNNEHLHAKEELADGLHFLVVVIIYSGLEFEHIMNGGNIQKCHKIAEETLMREGVSDVIKWLGTTMNCLKMKPWKQTHVLTDKVVYFAKLKKTFHHYIILMLTIMGPEDILNLYFSKSDVNKFRIKSNY